MVHASLRSIGSIEGRGEGLISALLGALGAHGTLMAYADFEWTPELPYFDQTRSPAQSKYGVFAELVRTHPHAVRSANPGASMVAIGERANWLCENHPIAYGYGPDGPLGRLVSVGGKVLLLGSDLDQVTLLHLAEHLADLPDKRIVYRTVDVMRDGGTVEAITIEEFDTSDPVVPTMPEKLFAAIVGNFLKMGSASSGRVGRATSHLLPAEDLVTYAVSIMERDYGRNRD